MREVHTEIVIDAPPAEVWRVLTDFPRWPEWNSILRLKTSADPRVGERVKLRVKLPPGFMAPLTVRLCSFDQERRLAWDGALGSKAIFHGEHSFSIEPLGANQSRFIHVEVFVGALGPLLASRRFLGGMTLNYELMNRELKRRVETGR